MFPVWKSETGELTLQGMSLHDANPKQPKAEFLAIFESLKQAPPLDSFDYSGLDPAEWDEAKRFIAEQRAKSLRESGELAKRLEESE